MIGYLAQNYSLIHAFAQPVPARRSRRETLAANRIFKMAPKLSDYLRDFFKAHDHAVIASGPTVNS